MISHLTTIWDQLTDWLTTSVGDVTSMFYDASTGFTLIGTLAVVGLGINVGFLLINVVKAFLRLR